MKKVEITINGRHEEKVARQIMPGVISESCGPEVQRRQEMQQEIF